MKKRRLKDGTWRKIYRFLQLTPNINTGNEAKVRPFVEGVYWITRTGAPWRDLPSEFGKWNSVYNRFADWSDKGVWEEMFHHFADDPDMEWVSLDSTIVRAHASAAGAPKQGGGQSEQALGKSRGGFSTKIHIAVDALGNPLRLLLTGGQTHDVTQAIPLLDGLTTKAVLADRAYDADYLLDHITIAAATAVIPSQKKRKVQRQTDWALYKERHLVECFVGKIKHFRRLSSRFEKYKSRYMAFLSFVCALIWLR